MRISDWSSSGAGADEGAGNTLLSDRGRDEREHSVVQGHLDVVPLPHADVERVRRDWLHWPPVRGGDGHLVSTHGDGKAGVGTGVDDSHPTSQIGRAPCGERGGQYV